jgi:hypothetical protein
MSEGLHPEQIKALRQMTPARRLEIALDFIEEMRQLKASALRRQHPDWAEERIAQALRDFISHADS